jgi:hypothetical protein
MSSKNCKIVKHDNPFMMDNGGETFFWVLSHCGLYDIIGTEPVTLNSPPDGCIHSEEVRDFHSSL